MAKCEKLHAAARENPGGLRFSEICRLAECFGCTLARSEGSHFMYTHDRLARPLNFQEAKNGMAKDYQVRQLLTAIEQITDGGENDEQV